MGFFSNMDVVPKYDSNPRFLQEFKDKLCEILDVSGYRGTAPKIIIFRPAARPGDEFEDAVVPLLQGNEYGQYAHLVVAFSGGYKDISDLVPYALGNKVKTTTVIYIQSGHLVSSDSLHYSSNQRELQKFAQLLSNEYGVKMRIPKWKLVAIGVGIAVGIAVIVVIVVTTTRS